MTFGQKTPQSSIDGIGEGAPGDSPTDDPPVAAPKLRDLHVGDRHVELHMRGLLPLRPDIAEFRASRMAQADDLIENAIGFVGIPLGVIPSLLVNGVEHVVPMATEERSVIASAAKAAKMCAADGGVRTQTTRPSSHAQILFSGPTHPRTVQRRLFELLLELGPITDELGGQMTRRDGAPVRVGAAYLTGPQGDEDVVLPLTLDTCDAMGANVVTRVAERLAAYLHDRLHLPARTAAICSNGQSGRPVAATAIWRTDDVARRDKMLRIARWAATDVFRAVTHNKGIMNGISAVALATGQDTRAIEACAHDHAARSGIYSPLSRFMAHTTADGAPAIKGMLTLWLPCGTAGGATNGPFFKECLGMLRFPTAGQLASIMAATGLVQNFAALWSLAGEGIPASHERLAHK